jgi:hypothetical protein
MKTSIPYEILNEDVHRRKGMYFLPFVPEHFDFLDVNQPEVTAVAKGEKLKQLICYQANSGPAVTAFVNNRPMAVFGIVYIWNGVGELWSIFDNEARERPATMLRTGISFCDIAIRYLQLHRLQITVRTDDNRALRYAKAIGFKTECVMQKYGPDQIDYLLMARF